MPGGKVINGRYELETLPLARGGMGEVWLGRDVKLEREVAVKFIRFPDGNRDEELERRFVRESRITARLEHPGVPAVYDVGTHDGRPYIVMQRIRGVSVADLTAEQGPLPIGWAVAIAAQTCAVLSVAHRESLVHRDLKPGNLMLERTGGVKVLDFGLAVAIDLADISQITRSGQTLGTPAYMAPEQILAAMSGPASDLYALGCTMHEMLTGRRLFDGSTTFQVMSRQVDERPRSVRTLRHEVPAGLAELMLALLEKKPEDRPASADEVYERLLPFATDLRPLPGVLAAPSQPSPVRMYAGVLHRVFADARPVVVKDPPPVNPTQRDTTGASSRFSRGDLDRARREAASLVRQSRYGQAAEVLSVIVEPASGVLGSTDEDVVSLRRELADVLFEGGDYRRAAPAYERLAADLARAGRAEDERVLEWRLKEATCHALTGQTSLALRQLTDLLRDEERIFNPDDERVLELRRQIGLLQLGAGQRQAARQTLSRLVADLGRLHGPDHPEARSIADLLEGPGSLTDS